MLTILNAKNVQRDFFERSGQPPIMPAERVELARSRRLFGANMTFAGFG